MRDRNNGKGNDQRRAPYDPSPTLVDNPMPAQPPAPVVQFATPEAAHTVTGPIREKYEGAVGFANSEWEQAFRAQSDIDGWLAEIADLQKRVEARRLDKQQHLHHAQQACDVANPAAVLLGMAGVHVPQIAAPAAVTAPTLSAPALSTSDTRVHPLDTSKPLESSQGSFPETEPDGFCINCGQPVWRTNPSETAPHGATHSYGATCDPNDPESKIADLGERVRGVAS